MSRGIMTKSGSHDHQNKTYNNLANLQQLGEPVAMSRSYNNRRWWSCKTDGDDPATSPKTWDPQASVEWFCIDQNEPTTTK